MEMTDHQLISSLKKVEENIQKTMEELSALKEEMRAESQKGEQSKVFKFIEDAKRVGFTTDLSTMEEFIEKKFGFPKGKAATYLIDYIEVTASSIEMSNSSKPEVEVVGPSVSETVTASMPASITASMPTAIKRKGPKPYSEMTPDELAIAKAAKLKKTSANTDSESSSVSTPPVKEKHVLVTKKSSNALKIWNSFLKVVQAEMESGSPTTTSSAWLPLSRGRRLRFALTPRTASWG